MKAGTAALEQEIAEASAEEWHGPLGPQRRRARAKHARARRQPRPPQGMAPLPHPHMARLAAARGFGGDSRQTPTPIQGQEVQMLLDSIREERVGTLVRFVGYLGEHDVIGGTPSTFEEHHAMQKYAYLASELGEPLHYEFNFLENGAYSPTLALDLYSAAHGGAGAAPFENNAGMGEAFVRAVRGKGKRTLQAMTFAMRDIRLGVDRDEFVDTMCRERDLYGRRLLERAFDGVFEMVGRAGAKDGQ